MIATTFPEVSVVIPVFNREKTLERSVESVLSQTLTNIEVLIVDDCSSDASKDIAQSFAAKDGRVKVIELKENHGAAYCRNYGVENAISPIIAFQDSDDVWRPDRLKLGLEAMRTNGAHVVIGRVDRHGYGKRDGVFPSAELKEGFVSLERVLQGKLMATPSILVDKQTMLANQFDTALKWCEDLEWSFRIAEQSSIYLIDEVVVDVYLQSNSITVVNADKRMPFYEKVLSAHQETLDSFPRFRADILGGYARELIVSGKDGSRYYLRAFKAAHRSEDFVKWVLAKIGVINHFYPKRAYGLGDERTSCGSRPAS